MSTNTKKGFFYGWIIVAACFIMQAIPFGVSQNIQPQFIGYVVEGEGFTLTQFSLLFTIGTIISAVASPFIGQLFDKPKMNVRLFYTAGAILTGVGFMLFGYCHSLWAFYGVGAVLQVGTAIISSMGIPVLINMWFHSKSGTALGIAFAGGGIGNVVLQQLAARQLAANGYGASYIYFGIMALIVGVPIALLLIRRPKKGELEAAGILEAQSEEDVAAKKAPQGTWGYSLKELKSIPSFWMFGIGFVFVGIYVSGMFVQFMAYFKYLNFDAATIGNIGSIFAIASILGNLCGGWLFDKIGIRNCLIFAGFLIVGCGLCLIFAPQVPMLAYVFAFGLGIAVFAYIIGPSYMTGALFGNKYYGGILGVVNIFFAVGYAFGAVIFGMVVDATGGYLAAWIFMTVIGGICYLMLMMSSSYFIKNAETKKMEADKEPALETGKE